VNLGEARHLLANLSDIHYWTGCACEALGEPLEARRHWTLAATFQGDFQEMSVRAYSEMTVYSALSLEKLGKKREARKLLEKLCRHGVALEKAPAKIDYFATSLPALLLFEDDLQARQMISARFLQAQALWGLGQKSLAKKLLKDVLRRDPSHSLAREISRDRSL
jgi:tetratricopeptide (TPR) repeat protein